MPNMFNVLYTRYIEQVKLQQIENYNNKHKDYLIRAGKQPNNPEKNFEFKNQSKKNIHQNRQIKPQQEIENNQNVFESKAASVKQITRQFPAPNQPKIQMKQGKLQEQRPIKSKSNKYDFENQGSYESYPPYISTKALPQNQYQNQSQSYTKFSNQQPVQQREIKTSQPINQFAQDDQNIVLEECPEGCGRKFKLQTLQKHVKICQKVFQNKRKPFKVDVVDDEAKKLAQKNGATEEKPAKSKQSKIPKWKKQSEMLRKGLKSQQQIGSSQSLPVEEQDDDRVQCGGCGRKFNEEAAKRHIPNCMKRNKQKR